MAGWNLKFGELKDYDVSDDRYWSFFNFVFSDSSRKRNTYKFGLIKSILDNLFNGMDTDKGFYLSYYDLFTKFAENYWNLVVKYNLRQMRKDGKSEFSKIETIFMALVQQTPLLGTLNFESIEKSQRETIVRSVTMECKKCVVGALYEDFDGTLYSFILVDDGLYISHKAYEFMLKYKTEIENLNYYAWAKFLEKVNSDDALVRVIDKLELATPKRNNLSVYREILRREFQECNCFYCGKQLKKTIHVDHMIPWSFVKDDKIWNFVLSCPTCNTKKNNRVPEKEYIIRLTNRNKKIQLLENTIIQADFQVYTDDLLGRIWQYAKLSGIKEFSI